MYGIGMPELIALLVIALIVIGPSKLPVGTLVKMNKDQKKKMDSAFRIALGLLLVLIWAKSPSYQSEQSGPLLLLGIALLGFGIYQLTQINKGTLSAGKLYCKKCGEQIGTHDQFCANCGAAMV
jgi:hypothetical protein